ncbi:MAG TPA: SHOCT domain-containing protein [Acidimicrobiales bacterium]|nr:SHOCT domain-containing protein [Acidimicrobiales bacterium]
MLRRRPIARMAVRTTVVAGTAAAVGAHAANKQAAGAAQSAPEAPAPAPEPAPAPAPAAAVDPIEQLTQLAALKDSGALTQEEFDAQKAKILG